MSRVVDVLSEVSGAMIELYDIEQAAMGASHENERYVTELVLCVSKFDKDYSFQDGNVLVIWRGQLMPAEINGNSLYVRESLTNRLIHEYYILDVYGVTFMLPGANRVS